MIYIITVQQASPFLSNPPFSVDIWLVIPPNAWRISSFFKTKTPRRSRDTFLPPRNRFKSTTGRCCSVPVGFSSSTPSAGRTPVNVNRVVVASRRTFSLLAEHRHLSIAFRGKGQSARVASTSCPVEPYDH